MKYTIQARRPTKLTKKDPRDKETVQVSKGKIYHIVAIHTLPVGDLVEVILSHSAGTWCISPTHWDGLPTAFYPSEVPKPEDREIGCRPSVPVYYPQRDNYRDKDRTCFSSACAMLLKFYWPSAIQDDNQYIEEVFKQGDTTNPDAQIRALRAFNLDCAYSQVKSVDWLIRETSGKSGGVVAIGWLHKGPAHAPSGGGHWSLCYGYDSAVEEFLIHDPWKSEFDHEKGYYTCDADGRCQRWSKEMMRARWTPAGKNDGWCIYVPTNDERHDV